MASGEGWGRLQGWGPRGGGLSPAPAPHSCQASASPCLRRAFLAAALAQGLCEVLLVVTKEVEEQGSWLRAD